MTSTIPAPAEPQHCSLPVAGRVRVLILTASVGEGHNRAADELCRRLRSQGAEVQVRDFLDALPPGGRLLLQRGYTAAVQRFPRGYHWLFGALERGGWSFRLARLLAWLGAGRVRSWARGTDAVVSTYPLASQALGGLVRARRLDMPTMTYLTDPAVHALWVSRGIARHLTVLPVTAQDCRDRYGIAATAVGALVPPTEHTPDPALQDQLRAELGIAGDRPVALLAAGSLGLGRLAAAQALAASGVATPIVLCGRNTALRQRLQGVDGVIALGWRQDVPALLRLADVFVHNAGGMSFTESLVAGVPAVTFDCIAGHGRANGEALHRAGIAPLALTTGELVDAVRNQLSDPARRGQQLTAYPRDASAVVLEEVLASRASAPPAAQPARSRRLLRPAATLAAVLTLWLGATQGVNAAVAEGVGVSRLPHGTASLIVPVPSRAHLTAAEVARLQSVRAAVVPLGAAPDQAWMRAMTAAGLVVVTSECHSDVLDQAAGHCGGAPSPSTGLKPVLVVGSGGADATDLLAAERHVLTLVQAGHTGALPGCPAEIHLVDIRQLATPSATAALQRRCAAAHVRLVPVTDARVPQ